MPDLGLTLQDFGVGFGGRQVLSGITLHIPPRELQVLMGPVASGKSTLLRTLAGLNHAQPELRLQGSAAWNGRALFEKPGSPARIALVMQKARFFVDTVRENLASALPNRAQLDRARQDELIGLLLDECQLSSLRGSLNLEVVNCSTAEQRHLAVARAVAGDPDLLLADEPTAGLDGPEAGAIIATLRREATRRAVLMVTHHHRHAQLAGGDTHLLVAGTIRETAPTRTFFQRPRTELGRTFLRTGGCLPPHDETSERSGRRGSQAESWNWPRGFFWVVPGEVGGLPRPGLLGDLQQDLLGLRQLGIRVVVALEETLSVEAPPFVARGLELVHFPIRDMGAPEPEAALALCRFVGDCVLAGKPVAFHCRAGLGRTGTMLACYLIQRGGSVAQAIEAVRAVNPLCIQSQLQLAFLKSLAAGSLSH